jgi:hypothetical protein
MPNVELPRQLLAKIYALFIDRGRTRMPVFEQHLDMLTPPPISVDDRRNEPAMFRELAENHPDVLNELFQELLRDLRSVSYERSTGILDALAFVQSVGASALWKHHCRVGDPLETFVRQFDRLDVPAERLRLYRFAQHQES